MIYRAKHTKDDRYILITKSAALDERLSYAARGVLASLLAKPDSWIARRDLVRAGTSKEGRTRVDSALKELLEHGYLTRRRYQNDAGHWCVETDIHESPTSQEPALGDQPPTSRNPTVGDPTVGKADVLISNDQVSNDQCLLTFGEESHSPPTPPRTDGVRMPLKPAQADEPSTPTALAEYLAVNTMKRIRRNGGEAFGAADRRRLIGQIKRVMSGYEIDAATLRQMMDRYADTPSLWDRNLAAGHPAYHFLWSSTIITVRNIVSASSVDDSVTTTADWGSMPSMEEASAFFGLSR